VTFDPNFGPRLSVWIEVCTKEQDLRSVNNSLGKIVAVNGNTINAININGVITTKSTSNNIINTSIGNPMPKVPVLKG